MSWCGVGELQAGALPPPVPPAEVKSQVTGYKAGGAGQRLAWRTLMAKKAVWEPSGGCEGHWGHERDWPAIRWPPNRPPAAG